MRPRYIQTKHVINNYFNHSGVTYKNINTQITIRNNIAHIFTQKNNHYCHLNKNTFLSTLHLKNIEKRVIGNKTYQKNTRPQTNFSTCAQILHGFTGKHCANVKLANFARKCELT